MRHHKQSSNQHNSLKPNNNKNIYIWNGGNKIWNRGSKKA